MPLNPVKSTHEGDWLHFTLQSGGMWHRQSSTHSWKAMISQERKLHFLPHLAEVDSGIR